MNRSLLAAVALSALIVVPAVAADMGRPPPPVYRAPPPVVPIFTWTGCYLGGHVGGLWASKDWINKNPGATFGLALAACDVPSFIDWAAGQPVPVVGTSDKATTDYATHRFAGPFILLMGSERQGLPPELQGAATAMVRIPMDGSVDSLNLAIANLVHVHPATVCVHLVLVGISAGNEARQIAAFVVAVDL